MVNWQQIHVLRFRHALSMSLHYFVKYECQKWRQSEICIVINDKSRGSIAKHLRYDELLYYTFIIQSAGERIFKIGEHLAKLQGKMVYCYTCPIRLAFLSSNMLISPDSLNNLCITDRNCY